MHATFPVTAHLFFIRDGRILLSRRQRTGYMDGYYSIPAGHLDGGETVRRAGEREAHEETGVAVRPEDLRFAGVFHRAEGDERLDFFLCVERWEGEPFNAEPEKCSELRWVEINHLPENTVPYVRTAIENHRAGIMYQEFGWGKV
jgi:8-oxo-dGTP diphosphatase